MTRPVEYRHECDTNAPAVRIFHEAKDAKMKIGGRVYTLCTERYTPSAEIRN